MVKIQDASHLQFRVETLVVRDGRKLGRLRPDENGYYNKMPVAALGVATRNKTYYEVDSFASEIKSPTSMFNQRLIGGQLYGELGHPELAGLDRDKAVARLVNIDEKNWAHHIRAVEIGDKLENGGFLLCADIKPTGVGRETVQENFDDPYMNTAFSLRSITNATQRGDLSYRVMKKLITFDFVGAGGYYEASKLFAPSMESFDLDLTPMGNAVFHECSMENFSDTEINEFFGTNKVQKQTHTTTLIVPERKRFSRYTHEEAMSTFHRVTRDMNNA